MREPISNFGVRGDEGEAWPPGIVAGEHGAGPRSFDKNRYTAVQVADQQNTRGPFAGRSDAAKQAVSRDGCVAALYAFADAGINQQASDEGATGIANDAGGNGFNGDVVREIHQGP